MATIKVKLLKALSYMKKEIFIKQDTQYTFTLIEMVQQKIKFKTIKRSKIRKTTTTKKKPKNKNTQKT